MSEHVGEFFKVKRLWERVWEQTIGKDEVEDRWWLQSFETT